VFASCMPRVQLYVNAYNGWPQFALQHHWLLPINCHFLRLYSAAGRGTAAVSSAIEESDLYLFYLLGAPSHIPWLYGVASCESWTCIIHVCVCVCVYRRETVAILTRARALKMTGSEFVWIICRTALPDLSIDILHDGMLGEIFVSFH